MFQLILVVVCLVLFVLRWSYTGPSLLEYLPFNQCKSSSDIKSPPVFPGRLPLIGHSYQIFGNNSHLWKFIKVGCKLCNKNGGVMMGSFGPINFYSVTDPDASLEIANTCLDKPYMYKFMKYILMDGLVTSDAKTWKLHRKLLNPAFSLQNLNTFIDVFNEGARELVSTLSKEVGKPPFDVQSYTINNLLGIATETTLGLSPTKYALASDRYSHSVLELAGLICKRYSTLLLHVEWIFNLSFLKKQHEIHHNIINEIAKTEIEKRKIAMKEESTDLTPDKFRPLLDQLLTLKEKDIFTEHDVMGHLHTIVSASFDTSASALNLILLFLGTYPDVQDRVYEEIKNIVGDRDVNKHNMTKLTYMEAVIKESLRLYPPGPIMIRKIPEDIKIKDYTLKGGSVCFIGLYGVNRHHMWGPDAEQFRPERWLDQASLPPNPHLYATFSLGKRNCIGRYYAIMVLKTYLSHILRRYRVYGDLTKLKLKYEIVLKPVSGHEIGLELRQ